MAGLTKIKSLNLYLPETDAKATVRAMEVDRSYLQALRWINVGLRAVMELAIVIALAWWGYHVSEGTERYVLAILAPAVGFGIWGAIDFRNMGTHAERLRLLEELAISFLAAAAWYVAGEEALGIGLATLSIVHHALAYLLDERPLRQS